MLSLPLTYRFLSKKLFAPNTTGIFNIRTLSSIATDVNASNSSAADSTVPTEAVVKPVKTKSRRKDIQPAPIHHLNIHDATKLVKELAWARFDETVEIAIDTALDPRKPNQNVRGVARLPHGTGKLIRVCVLAHGSDADAAREAGAEVVGAEDVIATIQSGNLAFDTVIATPEMMPLLGKVGRILGPRGLMPNPKTGTVTKEVAKAVKAAKAGQVTFKTEKKGIIQGGVGKVSFSEEKLLENIRAFMLAVAEAKPEGHKGKYLLSASMSSTMGPGLKLELTSVDPASPKFMLDRSILEMKGSGAVSTAVAPATVAAVSL